MAKPSIPVYLVTGFFGSGKTTFINYLLSTTEGGRRIAVLVNDFGDVNVDSEVISRGHGHGNVPEVHGVAGGSIFCSCRHWEFVAGLRALAGHKPDLIVVEASGMADPSPVKADIKIASDIDPDHEFAHAGTICLVDAAMFVSQLDLFPVVHRQVKQATIVVVNKVDLLKEPVDPKKEAIAARIRWINQGARVEYATGAAIPLPAALHPGEAGGEVPRPDRSLNEPGNQPGKLVLESSRTLARDEVLSYYDAVKDKILRFKGFCRLDGGWYHVDAVGGQLRFSPSPVTRERSEIVCIFVPADESRLVELVDAWRRVVG
ncbi:MAG: GTP-binding protein [Candidatus Lokiarchaeota archaeon]|nr:GTP-binding protein [Candidatus Lokiarchaeota archaeon]